MMLALRCRHALLASLVLLTATGCAGTLRMAEPLRITHGIASGDVTPTGVVIWARANRAAQMMVDYIGAGKSAALLVRTPGPRIDAKDDFTGKVLLDGLAPDTRYVYWVRFVDPRDGSEVASEAGQFKTAPAADAIRALSLIWGAISEVRATVATPSAATRSSPRWRGSTLTLPSGTVTPCTPTVRVRRRQL
jgi:phosphodiesterase/alkaline phosphatase D-like protein